MSYTVNYEDKRFQEVEADKQQAMTDLEKTYSGMIEQSDAYYNAQIDASKQWADQQSAIQQQQTDFAIEKIEQQKDQAKKDYTKEQSGAYVDWQKESNRYGVNAEQMASQGLANSGYSESSQVSLYNTYQNRYASAREVYNQAILNYNNAIKDAQLQNNAKLAEIAYQSLQTQLQLGLEGFQYKNTLLLEQSDKKLALEESYYNRYQDVLAQINYENEQAEAIRQFNEQMAQQASQFAASQALEREQMAQQKEISEAQLAQQLAIADADRKEDARQFDETLAYNKSKASTSSSSTSSSKTTKTSSISKTSSGSTTTSKSANNTKKNSTAVADKTSTTTYDQTMNSILSLGYGPISTSTLNSLVQSGVVEEYTKNGVQMFRNASSSKASTGSASSNKYKNALTIK